MVVVGGRQCRREVVGGDRAPQCHHLDVGMRWLGHEAMCRRGPLASEPAIFLIFFKIFHLPNIEIQNSDLPDVQSSPHFALV
jgi:hypothetical protein